MHVAPDHAADDVALRQAAHRSGVDVAAVAQHHHPVGDLLQLVEAVRDVDDADATRLEQRDLAEQVLDLARGQRRGRLVEDQQPAFADQAARDLDHLLVTDAERADRQRRVDVLQADPRHLRRRGAVQRAAADEAGGARQAVEQQVLGDAQARDEAQLLQHHAHAEPLGVLACRRPVGFASEPHRAFGRLGQPGDDPRERALAGAVLAGQRQHFAGTQIDVDLGEHLRRVALAEAGALEKHPAGLRRLAGRARRHCRGPGRGRIHFVTSTTSVSTTGGRSFCGFFSLIALSAVWMPNTACFAPNWLAVARTRPSASIGLIAEMSS